MVCKAGDRGMAVSYTHLDVYKRQSVSNVKYGMTTVTDGTMKNVNYESGQNGYFYETKLGDIFLFSERENEDSTGKIKSFCLTNDNVYFVKVDAPEEFAKRYDYIDAYEYGDEIIISTPANEMCIRDSFRVMKTDLIF